MMMVSGLSLLLLLSMLWSSSAAAAAFLLWVVVTAAAVGNEQVWLDMSDKGCPRRAYGDLEDLFVDW